MRWLLVLVAAVGARPHTVRGRVVDAAGAGVSGVTVFAVDADTRMVAAQTTSGVAGGFALALPRGRHRFGAVDAGWSLVRVEKAAEIKVVVQRQTRAAPTATGELVVAAATGGGQSLQMIAGRVIDETRTGLPGVGLKLVGTDGRTAAVMTGAEGAFATAVRPGRYQLQLFAPGLRIQGLAGDGNQWEITLGVAAGVDTVRIEQERAPDPGRLSARERAKLSFQGVKVSHLPRVSPTLADLQAARVGTPRHAVARQPLGAFCVRTTDCDDEPGRAVCCASSGELTDEYLGVDGIAGTCRAIGQCPGAQKYRRRP
jgi:hypothetical protein